MRQVRVKIDQHLIGGLEHFLLFHILGRIIPIDFHIFQRGRYTTNQKPIFLQNIQFFVW